MKKALVLPVSNCWCMDCDEARLAVENAYWEALRPVRSTKIVK